MKLLLALLLLASPHAYSAKPSPVCTWQLMYRALTAAPGFHAPFYKFIGQGDYLQIKNENRIESMSEQSVYPRWKQVPIHQAAELAQREHEGDTHPRWLRFLGITIKNSDMGYHPNFSYPEKPEQIPARINAYVAEMIRAGQLAERDAISVALVYAKKSVHPKKHIAPAVTMQDLLVVVPGRDEVPDPAQYDLIRETPQFEHPIWEELLASGKLPLNIRIDSFIQHDLAHVTELLENPKLMAATRDYYRWTIKQPLEWREDGAKVEALSDDHPASIAPTRAAHNERLFLATENFNLVSEKGKAQVRKKLPVFFNDKRPENWKSHLKEIEALGTAALFARAMDIYDLAHQASLRIGGTMRDPYNLKAQLDDVAGIHKPLSEAIFTGNPYSNVFRLGTIPTITSLTESFLGMAENIKWIITESFNLPVMTPDAHVRALKYLRETLAQLETGLAYSVIDDMKPEDFVKDLRSQTSDPNAKTSRFIARFAREDGALWRMFLSDAAQGKQPH